MLMGKGTITYMKDQSGHRETYTSDANKTSLPYVVLVNGNSASASEILSAAIKDSRSGKLVGTKTYGKGVVQSTQKFDDGSALKLTIMQYFSPKGHEQFLAIREGNGIFVFSGCSHKGTGPIIEYCRQLFPREKIKLFVSGMHLFHSGPEIREKVINDVVENIDGDIMPVHCTGIVAMCELKQAMGDRCIIPTAGESYEY